MDQVAPKCSTLFLFVFGRSDCFRMLWLVFRLFTFLRLYLGSSYCQI